MNKITFKDCVSDGDFHVSHSHLDNFFKNYVDFPNNDLYIDNLDITGEARSYESTTIATTLKYRREDKTEKKYSVKIVIEDDFDEDREDYI